MFTSGGGPTAAQRARAVALWEDLGRMESVPLTAIVTDSPVVRGIITAFAWLGGGKVFKAFHPIEVQRALDYLQVPEKDRGVVLVAGRSMMKRLGLSVTIAATRAV